MWPSSQRESQALDRHITGNYGENQFRGMCPKCDGEGSDESGDTCALCKGSGTYYDESPDPEDPLPDVKEFEDDIRQDKIDESNENWGLGHVPPPNMGDE